MRPTITRANVLRAILTADDPLSVNDLLARFLGEHPSGVYPQRQTRRLYAILDMARKRDEVTPVGDHNNPCYTTTRAAGVYLSRKAKRQKERAAA